MYKFMTILTGCVLAATLHAAEYPKLGEDIYDPQVDAAVDIAAALETATKEQKNVLLMFGANWCIWCHRLHETLQTDPLVAAELKENYVVVMVDVNTRNGTKRNADVNTRYGNPIQFGLPVLVVLDAEGKVLTTQETGALEDGNGHDPAKVVAFLQKWAPAKAVE
jgi:thioredoxin-related protein